MPRKVMVRFEDGQHDAVSKEYGPYPFVQLTYESLRVGPDGDWLAVYQLGKWHLDSQKSQEEGYLYFSDVVIYAQEKDES